MLKRIALLAALLCLVAVPSFAQSVAVTQIAVTPNSSAYTAGNCLGGVLVVGGLMRGGQNTTILAQEEIVDSTGTNAQIDLYVFSQKPTGTYTDHAACNIAAADLKYQVGLVANTAFTCAKDSSSATGICQATISVLFLPIDTTLKTMWVVPIVRSTPTYGASATLDFTFSALPG